MIAEMRWKEGNFRIMLSLLGRNKPEVGIVNRDGRDFLQIYGNQEDRCIEIPASLVSSSFRQDFLTRKIDKNLRPFSPEQAWIPSLSSPTSEVKGYESPNSTLIIYYLEDET